MPKNFEEFKSQPENYNDYQQPKYSIDPNLFVNEASSREISNIIIFSPKIDSGKESSSSTGEYGGNSSFEVISIMVLNYF
jgi:hypothetical protein